TTVYTVPASTEAIVSSVTICNRSSSSGTFRLAVRPDGATLANEHYVVYDTSIAANDTIILTVGLTLDATDVLEAYASSADMSFHAYGSEIS
ncbi:MAG: hypothetical protein ACO3O3_03025, partial [Ilumatobacteraceae bacterium]